MNKDVANCGLTWAESVRSGVQFSTLRTKKYASKLREESFQYCGPRLFNSLPRYLRDDKESTPADWKSKIDKFLCQIPDLPVTTDQVAGLCDSLTAAPTNSIIHWIPHLGLRDRRGKKDTDHKHLSPCVEPEDLVETERVQMENE